MISSLLLRTAMESTRGSLHPTFNMRQVYRDVLTNSVIIEYVCSLSSIISCGFEFLSHPLALSPTSFLTLMDLSDPRIGSVGNGREQQQPLRCKVTLILFIHSLIKLISNIFYVLCILLGVRIQRWLDTPIDDSSGGYRHFMSLLCSLLNLYTTSYLNI